MTKLTNYIFLSLLIAGLFSCNQQKTSNNSKNDNGTEGEINSFSENNTKSLALHDKLMNYFSEDWMERESDPNMYPDYYGGSFINNDGILVVTVTRNTDNVKELLKEALETDNFKVESVKYSYKEMLKVMDSIDEFLINNTIPDNHLVLTHFAGAYPDVMENRVKVLLTDVNQEIINLFKRDVTNSQLVIFEKGEIPELF